MPILFILLFALLFTTNCHNKSATWAPTMISTSINFKSVAGWIGGIFGEQPFNCYIFETSSALNQSGMLEEMAGKNISASVLSGIHFQKQSLLTFSWPDLNGQTIMVSKIMQHNNRLSIELNVQTSEDPIPQFGMNSILVQALILDLNPLADSILFQVNGQKMSFQVHRR